MNALRSAFACFLSAAALAAADVAYPPADWTEAPSPWANPAAPKGGRLVATARWRKDGRSTCVVNVDVVDDTGRDIAQFVGTGFKLNP